MTHAFSNSCFNPVSDGVEVFTQFLRTQFSEENIEFWLACEEFKATESATKLQTKAKQIHAIFIDKEAPKEVCTLSHFEQ